MPLKLLFFVLLIFIISCGKNDDSSSGEKSIFSSWTSEDGTATANLSGEGFGQAFSSFFLLETQQVYTCTMLVEGTEAQGAITVSNCNYTGGGSSSVDCASLFQNSNVPYNYTKEGVTLTLCNNIPSCESWY